MAHLIDITGQRFGLLTAVEKLDTRPEARGAVWRCVCDCGNEKTFRGTNLRRGVHMSCGCVRRTKMELVYIKNDPNWQRKRKSEKSAPCPYNEGVHCLSKDCWKCGWNPKVEAARKAKMEAQYGD